MTDSGSLPFYSIVPLHQWAPFREYPPNARPRVKDQTGNENAVHSTGLTSLGHLLLEIGSRVQILDPSRSGKMTHPHPL